MALDLQALIELSADLRTKMTDFDTPYANYDGYHASDVEPLLQAIETLTNLTAPTLPGAGGGDALDAVVRAAKEYYAGYCQDEADDDGPHFTGCSVEQHLAARALKEAIAALPPQQGG